MKKKRIAALLCLLGLTNGKSIQNNVQAMQPGFQKIISNARKNTNFNEPEKVLKEKFGEKNYEQFMEELPNLMEKVINEKEDEIFKIFDNTNSVAILIFINDNSSDPKFTKGYRIIFELAEKDNTIVELAKKNKNINFNNFMKQVERYIRKYKEKKYKEQIKQYIQEIKGKYNGPEDKRLIPKEFIPPKVLEIYKDYEKPKFVAIQKPYVEKDKNNFKCKIKLEKDIDIIPIFIETDKEGRKKDLETNCILENVYDFQTYNNDYILIPTEKIANSKEFMEYYDKQFKKDVHAEECLSAAKNVIMDYAPDYLFKERIINYSIKLVAELAAASLLVTVGVKYALHRANKSEQARRKKVEYDRKMKNQNDFDKMMKRINGHSSINYDKPWNEIEEIFEKLKDKAPHNAESIDKIKIKIKDFYSQSKANNFSKCIGISVNGTPGCGKTSFFLELMKNLGAEQPVIIGPADFDVDHKFLNVNQQVSGKWHIGSNERGYYAYGKLVAAIKHNEHPIIIVDELDKLPKSLRTLLWNAFKTGEIEIEGKKQSCKGAIFLFPCNQPLDDETKSISEFKFNTPNKESYKKALAKILTQIASSAKEKYKLNLEYSDSILDWMAQKCVNDDEGMRSIKVCKRFINSAIEVKYNSTSESKNLTRLKLDKDEVGHLICVES